MNRSHELYHHLLITQKKDSPSAKAVPKMNIKWGRTPRKRMEKVRDQETQPKRKGVGQRKALRLRLDRGCGRQ